MQAYLGRYARHHDHPVELDTAIEAVEPAEGGGFSGASRLSGV